MENLTQLFIHTPWRQAHRWDINLDGLVEYNDELLSPAEVYQRFIVDYPMFKVLRAEVSKRIDVEDSHRPYRWVTLERLDI
jgi:hypothetical protein